MQKYKRTDFFSPFFTEKQQTQIQKKQKEPEIEFYLWLLP